MRIAQLEKDQRGLVLDLDPLMMMDRLDFPDAFALIAVESDQKTRAARPVGLLIAHRAQELLLIDWLYIEHAHRMRGIGEQLLIAAFEYAAGSKIERLGAYFNDEFGRDAICSGDRNYFDEHLFMETQLLAGEWHMDLQQLAVQTNLLRKIKTPLRVEVLRNLRVEQANEVANQLLLAKQCETLYPIRKEAHFCDPDVSVILLDGDRLQGGLFVQCIERNAPRIERRAIIRTREHILYPMLCCAASDAEVAIMAAAALETALVKYKMNTQLHIILKDDRYAGLLKSVRSELRSSNQLMIARVADYTNSQGNDAQMLSNRRLLQLG